MVVRCSRQGWGTCCSRHLIGGDRVSLDLGELVGRIGMDISPLQRSIAAAGSSLDGMAADAGAAGRRAGDAASSELGQGLDGMAADAGAAGRRAGAAAADGLGQGLDGAAAEAATAGEDAGETFGDRVRSSGSDAAKAAGAALGLALAAGVADNLNIEAGLNRLTVQLGLSEAEARAAGDAAGRIWSDNFGEGMPEVNEAIAAVVRNIGTDINSVDLEPITKKVLTVADVFDEDLGGTTAAVGQMMRTGLVADASEALDILTVGLQGPANKAGDLMDTMNEYGTQFRKLGLNGAESLGLISQAMLAGARDSDVAADAIKEFSLRTQGSLTTTASDGTVMLTDLGVAFETVIKPGQDMYDVQNDLAAGGPRAKRAFDQMLEGLKGIEDPATRTRTAVSLFGTQAEDLGDALLAMDVSTAVDGLGEIEGAAGKAVAKMGDGPQATIEGWRRELIQMGRDAVESTGPTAMLAGAVVAFGPAVLGVLGPIGTLVAARAAQTAAAAAAGTAETAAGTASVASWARSAAAATAGGIRTAAAWVLSSGTALVSAVAAMATAVASTVAGWVLMGAQSLIGAAKVAAAWLIAMGPIGLAIAAIAGAVALIIAYWDDIKRWTGLAWDWVVEKVKAVPDLLLSFFQNFTLPGLIWSHWDDIKRWTGLAWDWVVEKVKAVPDLLVGFFRNWTLPGLIWSHWDEIRTTTKDIANSIVEWVGNLPERLGNKLASLGNVLASKAREGWQDFREASGSRVEVIAEWVSSLPERLGNRLASLGNQLAGQARAGWQDFRDAAGAKVEQMLEWVSGIPGSIKSRLGDLAGLLSGAGRDVVRGLWDGMNDMGGWLYDKLWDWIRSVIPGPIRAALGISSPSRVMAELAREVPAGVAVGIDEGASLIDGSVARMAARVSSASLSVRAPVRLSAIDRTPVGSAVAGGQVYNIYETSDPAATAREVARRQAFAGLA